MDNYSWRLKLNDQFSAGMDRAFDALKKFDAGWDKMEKRSSKVLDDLGGRVKRFRVKHAGEIGEAVSGLMDELPGGPKLAKALTNPYLAAGAAITGAVVMGVRAINDASREFQDNQQVVKTYFQGTAQEIDSLTAKTSAYAKVFGQDKDEIARSAKALAAEFGETNEQSFELIKTGLQATRGSLDLDYIKEYSSQLKAAGLNARETLALAVESQRAGIYQDKALDAIKEANLRLTEMPKATQDALMGMEQAGAKFEIGGKLFGTADLIDGLKEGRLRTIDVMREISGELDKINPQARQKAIADIFGAPGEDAGGQFFQMLANSNLALEGLVNKSDGFIQRQERRLALEEQLNMKVAEFAGPVNEVREEFNLLMLEAKVFFFEIVGNGMTWFRKNSEALAPIWEGLKTVFQDVGGKIMGVFKIAGETVAVIGKLMTGDFSGAWESLKSIGLTAVNDVLKLPGIGSVGDLLGTEGSESLGTKAGKATALPMSPSEFSKKIEDNISLNRPIAPTRTRAQRSTAGTRISGPGQGGGKSITVNINFGDTVFRVSSDAQMQGSIEEWANKVKQVLLREVANFEATA